MSSSSVVPLNSPFSSFGSSMSLHIVLLFLMLPPREWPGSADGWPRASGQQHHLRLLELSVGLLVNFGAATLKQGLHRIVNQQPA